MTNVKAQIKQAVKSFRIKYGMTRRSLSYCADVTEMTVYRWETRGIGDIEKVKRHLHAAELYYLENRDSREVYSIRLNEDGEQEDLSDVAKRIARWKKSLKPIYLTKDELIQMFKRLDK